MTKFNFESGSITALKIDGEWLDVVKDSMGVNPETGGISFKSKDRNGRIYTHPEHVTAVIEHE